MIPQLYLHNRPPAAEQWRSQQEIRIPQPQYVLWVVFMSYIRPLQLRNLWAQKVENMEEIVRRHRFAVLEKADLEE